jgi:hypothetical protein
MPAHSFTVRLEPLCHNAYTRLRLCVCVPTPLPAWALRRLCDLLARFSGHCPSFVLSAGKPAAPWSELWIDSIAALPARHANVRLLHRRREVRHERRATPRPTS